MRASKLVLGTVQFGVQYGVNSAGRPDAAMVRSILNEASANNITVLDTSAAYGNAEERIFRKRKQKTCNDAGLQFFIVCRR